MFHHFVGNIYILEKPPEAQENELNLELPDEILADIDKEKYSNELSKEQLAKLLYFREQMAEIIGEDVLRRLRIDGVLLSSDTTLLYAIASEISNNRNHWRGLKFLNSDSTEKWEWILMKTLRFIPGGWDYRYGSFAKFVAISSQSWTKTIPELLDDLDSENVTIEDFFKMEKNSSYKLAALLNDVNVLQKEIIPDQHIDISTFIGKLSRGFLPSCVMALEEYGLPRMISRKLHDAQIIDFEDENISLHDALRSLTEKRSEIELQPTLDNFDRYVIDYFFSGITSDLESKIPP